MAKDLIAKSTVYIERPIAEVWSAITDPEKIQRYMMGMKPVSDWKVNSDLNWIGRHPEDPQNNAKGIIEKLEPEKLLQYTFFYPGYGYPDQPENYHTIIYQVSAHDSGTTLEVSQGEFSRYQGGEEMLKHTKQFWDTALKNLKDLLETAETDSMRMH